MDSVTVEHCHFAAQPSNTGVGIEPGEAVKNGNRGPTFESIAQGHTIPLPEQTLNQRA